MIHDLGSSNGTLLNSNTLDPDTPVDLRHGDNIKLGEYTSIVVNFVIDVVPPPRPRRNTRRHQVKPAGKRTRVSENSILGEEEGLDVENENKPSFRVRKARRIENTVKLGITEEEELVEEKKGKSRVLRTRNVAIQGAVEISGKGAKNSKASRSKNIEIVEKQCLGLVNVDKDETVAGGAGEETVKEKRITRATRSKTNEIVGDGSKPSQKELLWEEEEIRAKAIGELQRR